MILNIVPGTVTGLTNEERGMLADLLSIYNAHAMKNLEKDKYYEVLYNDTPNVEIDTSITKRYGNEKQPDGTVKTLVENGFEGYARPDHGRNIFGEDGKPSYGLYDRALGCAYINGLFEMAEKKGR